eukprot:scaffold3240_cov68-Cylindrotheca_fusiformis.AAC.5
MYMYTGIDEEGSCVGNDDGNWARCYQEEVVWKNRDLAIVRIVSSIDRWWSWRVLQQVFGISCMIYCVYGFGDGMFTVWNCSSNNRSSQPRDHHI